MTEDWRLTGQEKYLKGATLTRKVYWRRKHIDSQWDDDHCEFCKALFMADNFPDVLHEGYTTPNDSHWICDDCFADFKDMFGWEVASPSPGDDGSA